MGDKPRPSSTPIIFTRVQSGQPVVGSYVPPPSSATATASLPIATAIPVPVTRKLSAAAPRGSASLAAPPPIPPKPRGSSPSNAIAAQLFAESPKAQSPSYEPLFSLTPGGTPPSYSEAKRMLEASDRASGLAVTDNANTGSNGSRSSMMSTSPPGGPVTGENTRGEGQPDNDNGGIGGDQVDGVEGGKNIATIQRITDVLGRIQPLVDLEERTGVGRLYLAVIIAILLCLLFVAIFGIAFFSSVIAFTYPAYMSYKSLERDAPMEHMHWLIYWVVYGVFHLLEPIIDAIFFDYIPFYRTFKLVFLVWCFLPQTKGCAWLYAHTIRPILHHNETNIDAGLVRLNSAFGQITREVREMGAEILSAVLGQVFGAMTSIRLPSENRGNGNGQRDDRKLL